MNTSKLPFFSIITASYDRGNTIENTLNSLSNQSFQDFEHIVIDGGSTDNTLSILERYSNKYNLTWISEPDSGIADALNKGLKLCTGKYILVIQADDYLFKTTTLKKVHHILLDEFFDIYSFPIIYDSIDRGQTLHSPIRALWWNHFKFIFLHQGTFVHQRVFEKIGIFSDKFRIAMDYDFLYRALRNKCTVSFQNIPVAVMGGDGIGSRPGSIQKRLFEEGLVQKVNEESIPWRIAQTFFRLIYVPYKSRFPLSSINLIGNRNS